MRIKLIRDVSMSAAMATLRDTLGEEAFILSSRVTSEGGVELTAALDPEIPEEKEQIKSSVAVQKTAKKTFQDWHGLDLEDFSDLGEELNYKKIFSDNISFKSLDLSANASPVMVCGAPGSGKTLTIARLATRLALAGISPVVMTTDTERSGALEQLAACTRILGLDLIAVESSEMLRKLCRVKRGKLPILIDTGGVVPFDEQGMKILADLQNAAQASLVLVHPAGEDPAETEETVSWFHRNGASRMIVSRTDCTRRLGGIVRGAMSGISLAEASTGNQLIGGLRPLDPSSLNELMISKWETASAISSNMFEQKSARKIVPSVPRSPTHPDSNFSKTNVPTVTGAAALMRHIAAQGGV